MVALIVGLILIAFTVCAMVPSLLGWWTEIVLFLKGFTPVFAAFIGLLAVFIGIADIKDKREAKREEMASREQENSEE